MDKTELHERSDWPELRVRLGELLKRRAFARGLNAQELAQRLGRKLFKVERAFQGTTRDSSRYEDIAVALDWTLEEAIELLDGPRAVALPAPRLRRSDGVDEALDLPDLPPTSEPMNDTPDTEEEDVTELLHVPKDLANGPPATFEDHRGRIANELKEMISASGRSQTEWAGAIGVSQSTISSVLAARHKRRGHYDNLARELGYFISASFTLEEMPKTPSLVVTPGPAKPLSNEPGVVPAPSRATVRVNSASRLELDDTLVDLIEWSASQRGIDPKIWLTLAVAAYHEFHADG